MDTATKEQSRFMSVHIRSEQSIDFCLVTLSLLSEPFQHVAIHTQR